MKILVDTSVWSLALRKKPESGSDIETVAKLSELIRDSRAVIIGAIRQEILSGISSKERFELLKTKIRAFEDLPLTTDIYELAAEFSNTCRSNGIQGSHTDFLICAAAAGHNVPIYTLDNDFEHYRKYIDIKLY
ncbi:type II toxin-antitoxin system VapC family toxin [Seleniivibrio woodruffii]|uniref:PIN domain-containing protein n=1 Tax=Seleniivibrio woodruffii TaxID=1078050 RepID=A0A4R1K6I8_9BACT|nr:PIN domain-containing protein [Seleniivibrio woodruffii]TCK59383.1 hypothetical protein C8D98_2317 [Seleniivibrio woodruffii]TVZ35576.1 hypothetical protein OF66_1191 [Seleniivibrio woodruffii]